MLFDNIWRMVVLKLNSEELGLRDQQPLLISQLLTDKTIKVLRSVLLPLCWMWGFPKEVFLESFYRHVDSIANIVECSLNVDDLTL